MRVLLVEDDPSTFRSIELMLSHANLNVYSTDLGEEGVDLAKLYDYDLILLDLNLPDMHGHDVLRKLRLARVNTPILILTGSDDTETKIKGFGFGADDYLTKPFHREELVARIHAIIRRSKGHSQSVISTGKIVVNLDAKSVETDGRSIHLTGKEYQMLELLSLDVMRKAHRLGDTAGVVDIAAGTAGTLLRERCAVIVELQRHADHIVALRGKLGGNDRTVHAT